MRKIKIVRNYNKFALGSCLFCMGDTQVLCNATMQQGQPPHLKGTNSGWITAEYFMLPQASSQQRSSRQQQLTSGRSKEISRIIGRSLRAVVNLDLLGPNTVVVDCDVLQADGGTRTAAINGSFVAIYDLFQRLVSEGKLTQNPITKFIASISVGVVNGKKVVDLSQKEDNNAEVDTTIVMTENKELVELQFTAEKKLYDIKLLNELILLGWKSIKKIIRLEKKMFNLDKSVITL
ncbi:MAG: ribonuclease PH [Endomicrobia bacterium]|nr:ribonuclease PH [Endomicrobiia bacterium]MCX7940734.1 ribonuclease PH [Endomicrobiia bacterium]MDW8056546.1 ribonuclease PH [Elusimicrobiota bacterium]